MRTNLKLLLLLTLWGAATQAQILNPKEKAKRATENRANSKVDKSIDKGLDKVEEGIGNLFKKKKKSNTENTDNNSKINKPDNNNANNTKPGQSNSFLDFVPGPQIIFADNFEQDAMMDFPAKWNTTGSGKVVTMDGVAGRWFDVVHNSVVNPVMDKVLPENCTIEFDLFLQSEGESSIPYIKFGLTQVRDVLKEDISRKEQFYTRIGRYNEEDGQNVDYGIAYEPIATKNDFPLTKYINKILRVSMAINKTRIRVYLDQSKIIDLPRALTTNMRNNFFIENVSVIPASKLGLLVGNLRIASGDVDARSLLVKQLLENGKAVTSDILFDVNSDVIKTQSYSIIKQFGEALEKEPTLKIKIVGHTDSDGADGANLILSQKRAGAVKAYITENFSVTGSRIQTDGKGETQAVAPNTTAAGKAENRRVEFIKL